MQMMTEVQYARRRVILGGGGSRSDVDVWMMLATMTAAAPGPVTTTSYQQKVSAWSKRLGVLFQPKVTARAIGTRYTS